MDRILRLCLLLLLAASVPGVAGAQERPKPTATAPGDEVPPPSRVYIPFEDLKKVFEKEGQGVFVPYEEFQRLWKRAMDRPAEATAPSGVSTAFYEGRVEGDLAVIEAALEVIAASDGESAIPVGLAGAALGEATLDGKPAAILDDGGVRRVVVRGKGAHSLKVTLVATVQPRDGDRTVCFPSAGAPVSRLVFTVPGEGVRVTVEPNLATTRTDAGSGTTKVMAFVGSAPEVRLTWRPRPVEAAGTVAVLQAQTETLYRVGEQTLETWFLARLSVLRGGMRTFRVRYPAADRVLRVEGSGIRAWEETEDGADRELRVDLHEEVEGTWDLHLTMERPRVPGEAAADLPAIVVAGASRDSGTAAVQVIPPVAVRPAAADGLYRVPTDDLSEWMRTGFGPLVPGVTVLAYRHAGGPRRLSVAVETVAPEVSAAERSLLEIAPGSAVLRAALDLTVERAGLFQVAVALPAGWDLESAQGGDGGGMKPVDARVEGEGSSRRATLDLGTRRAGAVPILLVLRRPLAAGEAEASLDLPALRVLGALRSRGVLGIAADESFDVRTGTVKGLVPADPAEIAAAALPAASPAVPGGPPRPVLFGFRHAGEERAGTLSILRRKPLVTAVAVTVAGAEEDRLRVRHSIRYTVRYAGVDTLRFSLPAAVSGRARIEGPGVKEKSRAADPTDAAREIHAVVLQAPALGEATLEVEYDLPAEPLAAGGSRKVAVPEVGVPGVDRETGWIAVTRDPSLAVEGEARGLAYADAREVPAFARAGDAFLAWRWLSHPHGLDLQVAKHEPVPVLQAVVNALALDTLVGGGAVALTEARMDVQVNGLQYLRVILPAGAEVESAEVDGKSVPPRKEKDALLLPCPPGRGRDDRFPVRLVYREAVEGAAGRSFRVRLEAPGIPEALVQATGWTLWVPAEAALFSGGGNLVPAETPSVLGAVLDAVGSTFASGTPGGRPTVAGGALPPQVALTTAGRRAFSFQRTGEKAVLEARFLSRAAVGWMAVLAGVLAVGAGVVLARRGLSPFATAAALLALGLLPFPSAAPGLRPALAALLAAAALLALGGAVRCARAARAAAPPSSPPPSAPPAPPAHPSPPPSPSASPPHPGAAPPPPSDPPCGVRP